MLNEQEILKLRTHFQTQLMYEIHKFRKMIKEVFKNNTETIDFLALNSKRKNIFILKEKIKLLNYVLYDEVEEIKEGKIE